MQQGCLHHRCVHLMNSLTLIHTKGNLKRWNHNIKQTWQISTVKVIIFPLKNKHVEIKRNVNGIKHYKQNEWNKGYHTLRLYFMMPQSADTVHETETVIRRYNSGGCSYLWIFVTILKHVTLKKKSLSKWLIDCSDIKALWLQINVKNIRQQRSHVTLGFCHKSYRDFQSWSRKRGWKLISKCPPHTYTSHNLNCLHVLALVSHFLQLQEAVLPGEVNLKPLWR